MSGEPAVRVEALGRRFGDVVAVNDLTFTVDRGELFGLLGPDGAGKTTTLRMLAGVLRPTAGDALINGISVVRDPEATKRQIAYMSQRFGLYGDLTVLENLAFYADLYQVPREERVARMERLFHFSNLGPFRHRLAGKLSGGMKQKLGLSCALIHQPQVLLLDEPTFGVDPISRRDLWLIVHDMVAQGVTVVVSTAYMDEAERFDRLAVLHQGRLLALDRPAALQQALEGEMLSLQVDRPRAARDLAIQLPTVRRAAVFGDRLHVTLRTAGQDAGGLIAALASGGVTVAGSDPVTPSMEDVFIALVAEGSAA
ncbi:MAG: ABC transporter ATP-binding protein [Gemmatimonadales bacterium]|nr:ABC transporter ATP-binding protein [Gemmatimonadales bacterium]MBP9198773.1 ABC transporter ATP-binding protein [Gemmatimonadales bacterium]